MHLGNYIKELIREKRFSVSEIAEKVSKSETSVRKDFEKEALHMGALEAYANVLGTNIYHILSEAWKSENDPKNPKSYSIPELISKSNMDEDHQIISPKKSPTKGENVSISIDISGPKKDAILKILFEK